MLIRSPFLPLLLLLLLRTTSCLAGGGGDKSRGGFALGARQDDNDDDAGSPPPDTTDGGGALAACRNLRTQLGSTIVQTSSTSPSSEWTQTLTAPWNLANVGIAPTCIVFPYDHTHVSAAMREIFKRKARYAVQAGSHTAMKNWNVVKDGVLIMFSHMKNASYNTATETVTLQPGLLWEDAILATEKYGIAPVGGRVRDVGTGLLLGGGISFLSPEHGFASDNYKSLDVVLPNGDFVTATVDNRYSDLFWALKACANRCGIVTRYELYVAKTGTREEKRYFGGTVRYPASSSVAIIKAIAEFNKKEDPKAIILTLFNHNTNPDGSTDEFTDIYMFYQGPSLPPSIYCTLLSIPSTTKSLRPLSYYDIVTSIPKYPAGSIQFFGGGAHYRESPPTSLLQTHANWRNFTKMVYKDVLQSYLAYTPLLGPMIEAGRRRGGNPIDAPKTKEGFVTVNFGLTLPLGVGKVKKEVESARQLLFKQSPPSPGLPIYIGEIDAKQNAYATYGQYERLKKVYKKYDPTRFIVNHLDGPIGL
ncbi:hypothetical protein AMATHDRAFT_69208 [Amanita thiersii Skay4041]|uniref:FAD-binding PCMH-type domain-containing protein n=1 Tax=Amanita thiersii Skay4041 TaxID=703135 RepID=A0A2A9NEQ0_9AGAR|nr:hypothetical protein AMATHDRAFT_69208 [Amanita thiersii Skay4041]